MRNQYNHIIIEYFEILETRGNNNKHRYKTLNIISVAIYKHFNVFYK